MKNFAPGPKQAKFFAALRSGKYTQAKRALKTDTGFCCLGVACVSIGRVFDAYGCCEAHDLSLPSSVIDELGFKNKEGTAFDPGTNLRSIMTEFPSCARMNDFHNKSFSQIADFLEANIQYYFTGPK